MPSFARTVRCATGTGHRSATGVDTNARTNIANSKGPSTIANPAPGHTRGPDENGM